MGCSDSIPKHLYKSDKPFYKLVLSTKIWNKDSHGLFDYHNDKLFQTENSVLGNNFVYADTKSNNDVNIQVVSPLEKPIIADSIKVLSIGYKGGNYWVYHANDLKIQDVLKTPAEQAWIPIKSITKLNNPQRYDKYFGYKLKQGDIVKFGRVRFRVKKISSNNSKDEPSANNITFNSHHFGKLIVCVNH